MRFQLRAVMISTALALAPVVVLACGDDEGGSTDPTATGDVRVQVTTDGVNAAGVPIRLFESGATTSTESGTTEADGTVTFEEVETGAWEVEIVVPAGTELVAGQDDRAPVTVTDGQTSQVSFALETTAEDVVEVVLRADLTFSPAEITISPGTTVRWRNAETIFHTVTPDGHSEWTSASLNQEGELFTHTFENTGTFPYFCEPHQADGMTGTVTVE